MLRARLSGSVIQTLLTVEDMPMSICPLNLMSLPARRLS